MTFEELHAICPSLVQKIPSDCSLIVTGIDCDAGWDPVLRRHLARMEYILRDIAAEDQSLYQLHGIKDYFGILCLCMTSTTEKLRLIMREAIIESSRTCSICSSSGLLCRSIGRSTLKTLCSICAAILEYELA